MSISGPSKDSNTKHSSGCSPRTFCGIEPGTSAIAGEHAGSSQLVQFFSKLMELSEGTLAFEEIGPVP